MKKIIEYVKIIISALILAFLIMTFIVQAFKIPSGSMIPTLLIGDHLLVNKFIYGIKIPFTDKSILAIKKPKRGDIVIFKFPKDTDKDFIKRVIGVEGDVIEIRDKILFVNGKEQKESYIQHSDNVFIDSRDNFGPYIVPPNKIFVMGDNRDQSNDSRFWGDVDMKYIKGEALILYWSWDNTKTFPRFERIGRLIK